MLYREWSNIFNLSLLDHGYCVSGNDCHCLSGWTGSLCNKDLNKCRLAPCKNGATCANSGPDAYTCSCVPGYTGTNCENGNSIFFFHYLLLFPAIAKARI